LVEWVTEPGGVGPDGKKPPWEVRNRNYLERIRKAPAEALTLSCADKTSNIREMCYWLEKGSQDGGLYKSGPRDQSGEV
jgi:hypothetical protein